jgi:hypothetical protein
VTGGGRGVVVVGAPPALHIGIPFTREHVSPAAIVETMNDGLVKNPTTTHGNRRYRWCIPHILQ